MPTPSPILTPVVVLALWTFVMWVWMYATRLPAMKAARMKPDPVAPRGKQMSELPARVRWKADNYNHLHEQPQVFYAVAIVLALLGQGDGLNLQLAWGYVGLRVTHSLVQALVNKIELRFSLFALGSIVLMVLTVRAAMVVLG